MWRSNRVQGSLCAWPRTRVPSCCLLFCLFCDGDAGDSHPFCEFKIYTNAFKSKKSEEFSHPCIDQNGVFSTPHPASPAKPPDEHVASPIFHHVDLIAQGQDCCSRQCIFETASQNRRHSNTAGEASIVVYSVLGGDSADSSCVSQRH